MTVTAAQLKKLMPGGKTVLVHAVVDGWSEAEAASINTPKRVALFLAMIGVETGGLKAVSENMNYTTAARIKATWPTRFKTEAAAKPYVRQPQKLANFVYGTRLGNRGGNDGWLYRGSAMMQTTGRANFAALGFEANPEALRDPAVAFSTAVREWTKRKCNSFADKGDVKGCRKAINGGLIGLDEVQRYYAKGLTIFAAQPSAKPAALVLIPADNTTLRSVQQKLRDLGYPEVGDVDGKPGTKTTAAILAFRADNALPLKADVDADLLAALMTAPHRVVSASRASATAADLKGSKSIDMASTLQKAGAGVVAASGIGGLVDVQENLERFRSISETVTSIAPWMIGALAGGIAIYFGARFIREQVLAFREGRHV